MVLWGAQKEMIDKPVRILIADDHPLVRRALGGSLSQLGQVTLEEAGSLEETLSKVAAIPDLDLVVFDLRMPGSSGLGGSRSCAPRRPTCPWWC